ncbi:hypothetical protein DFH09DRAFT_1415806 [Mycena vulgaris]|nr:hypothetical protein DFH09DRAFT_1415806 [Mycena vulgaris]
MFADAAARLTVALEPAKHREEEFNKLEPISVSVGDSTRMDSVRATGGRTTMSILTSFMPVLMHLAECIAALRDTTSSLALPLRWRRLCTFWLLLMQASTEPPALQAYEQLRRELGFALRECERRPEWLLNVEKKEDVPLLEHNMSDECESDKLEEALPMDEVHGHDTVVVGPAEGDRHGDDAMGHLLLGALAGHLPCLGVEQVFESEAKVGIFAWEQSKLTRLTAVLEGCQAAGGRVRQAGAY